MTGIAALMLVSGTAAVLGGDSPAREEKLVRAAVQSFYDAFNAHDFARAAEFTTEDWTHVNPLGGWTRGRDAVLGELREVHATFLKGASDTPEQVVVRMAGREAAIATVPSRVSTYTTPDGRVHANERQIRTFVVVKERGRWRIAQDHNTVRAR